MCPSPSFLSIRDSDKPRPHRIFRGWGCPCPNPLGYFPGPVSDDEICACSPEGSHQLQDRIFFINPPVLGCRLEHGVFTAHVVNRSGHLEPVFYPPEYVQIWQAGFYDQQIGTLFEIQGDLSQRFAGVGRIHLIAAAIAKMWGTFGRLSEWTVESRAEFCRIAHYRNRLEAPKIKFATDYRNPTIHHIARCDDIGSGFRQTDRCAGD